MSLPIQKPMSKAASIANRRRDWLWLAVISSALGIAVFLLAMGERWLLRLGTHAMGLRFELAAGGLGIWLALLTVWWARQSGRFDPFEPPFWISLNVYGQVVLNVWWLKRDIPSPIPWVRDNQEWLMPLALVLLGVGLTALWAGYAWTYLRIRQYAQRLHPRAGSIRLPNVVIIWILGWTSLIISVLFGTSSYLGAGGGSTWTYYFSFIRLVYLAAASVLVIHHFRHSTLIGWIWLVLFLVSDLIASLVVGSKAFTLTWLWLIICVYYAIGRISRRLLFWLVLGFVIAVLFVPVVNDFRLVLRSLNQGGGLALPERIPALSVALEESLTQPFNSSLQNTGDTFKSRQSSLLDISASVLFLHPNRMPFVGYEMLEYFVPQLIPRVFSPNKSTERPGIYLITITYAGVSGRHGHSDIGLFADSYRAGGWVSVVIWFVVLGAFAAWLYLQGPGSENLAGTVFYVVLVTSLFSYHEPITVVMLRLIQFAPLLWAIIVWGMFSPLKKEQALRQ